MLGNPNLDILQIVAVGCTVVVAAAAVDSVDFHTDFAAGSHNNCSNPLVGIADSRIAVGFHNNCQLVVSVAEVEEALL